MDGVRLGFSGSCRKGPYFAGKKQTGMYNISLAVINSAAPANAIKNHCKNAQLSLEG
jgi:hypothetical protein